MKNSFSKKASTGSEVEKSPVIKQKPFNPTDEQSYCNTLLKQEQILKMEAVAGSGKSSTLYYLGRENPEPSLGLVFNKTMALEATEKSPDNIKWCTTHSLAYRAVGKMYQHKLSRPKGRYVNVALTGAEIARYFKLPDFYFDQDSVSYVSKAYLGLIIRDTVNQFEISVDQEIEQKHVPFHHIKDLTKKYGDLFPKKKFVGLAFRRAKELWEERKDIYSDVMMNHNSYLKLYHLSNPTLSEYKILYIDESQDINPVTMDIIMKQKDKCKIVWVGDKYQSIYQFNGAVNAMDNIKSASCSLTKSFRFGQTIADVANTILRGKVNVIGNENIESVASGEHDTVDTSKPYTILFRTNMELIFQSVKMITEGKDVNVNTDLKDFMALVKSAEALHKGDLKQVKHENILPFNTWDELLDEAKVDGELRRVSSIVENDQTEHIVNVLHTYKSNPNAHINIVSAHKSKGLEWDQVILGDDFPSNYDHKGRFVGLNDQEENLLYVASTRAEKVLQWNSTVQELVDLRGGLPTKGIEEVEEPIPDEYQRLLDDLPCEQFRKHKQMVEEYNLPDEGYHTTFQGREVYAVVDEDGVECHYDDYVHYLAACHDDSYDHEDLGMQVNVNSIERVGGSSGNPLKDLIDEMEPRDYTPKGEMAQMALQETLQEEEQRDRFANHLMSDEEAFDRGYLDPLGVTTEFADFDDSRINIFTDMKGLTRPSEEALKRLNNPTCGLGDHLN